MMPLPTHISESVRRLNPQLFGQSAATSASPQPTAKRIRQHKGDGMNKWEREYHAMLTPAWSHVYREVSLPLANGVRYKLDFLVVSTAGTFLVAGFEVKGRARAAGIAKLKIAASLYPWIKFWLVSKRKKNEGGGWVEERVNP